jgi:hypothetical protein
MPAADYDAGCPVRSTSTNCPTRKSSRRGRDPVVETCRGYGAGARPPVDLPHRRPADRRPAGMNTCESCSRRTSLTGRPSGLERMATYINNITDNGWTFSSVVAIKDRISIHERPKTVDARTEGALSSTGQPNRPSSYGVPHAPAQTPPPAPIAVYAYK